MSRTALYEYCCSGDARGDGSAGVAVDALSAEGRAMLAALAADFAAAGLSAAAAVSGETLESLRATCDAAVIIAPETGGVLADVVGRAERLGYRVLGPTVEAIRLTGDKRRLGEHWRRCGVPTPADATTGWRVEKPADGAGAVDTWLLAPGEPAGGGLVQEYVPGEPASVAFLCGGPEPVALVPCRQRIVVGATEPKQAIAYDGGELPLPAALAARAVRVARRAIDVVPGLRGYVGVDVILGDRDVAVEINPRLTTSYLGLRAACRGNLAAALVAACAGESPRLDWSPEPRRWMVDGFDSGGGSEIGDRSPRPRFGGEG